MFNKMLNKEKKALETQIDELECKLTNERETFNRQKTTMDEQLRYAKDKLADTKHEKKMSDEDIKHMVKLAKEKDELTLKRKIMDVEAEKAEEIAKVKDEYRDKMEERLQKEVEGIKEMYGQILERLPNVNARLKGDI